MIEVKNLVKRYGDYTAVDHLNFTVEKGQIYGFLGPNGAGKSTTMNMMTGYLGMTEGEVFINGHSILEEPEAAKQCIGYLPELPPLYTDMKVYEYLEFAAELKKVNKKEREAEIETVMNLTKLQGVCDRLIKNLSKGYRQRVGLAQAMLGFPEIIILDEPTVGLDPKQIIEIRELIRELAKEHTVILSSHILAEVQEVCDYVMIISQGRLVASDTPENLEKLVKGKESVEVTAMAERERIAQILETVGDIASVDYATNDDGTTQVMIEAKENTSICQEIAKAFAEHQIPVLRLDTSKVSLEDVFLELTQSEALKKSVNEKKKHRFLNFGKKNLAEDVECEEDEEILETKKVEDGEESVQLMEAENAVEAIAGEIVTRTEDTKGGEEDAGNL